MWEWWSRCVQDRRGVGWAGGGGGREGGRDGGDPTWTENKRGTDWGRGHYTTHTTKGWRGEVHERHNTAKVPLFYPRFISPPSLQIFGGTLWITYWYWEYCTLYIVERNYGSLSFSLFKDGCFVLFGFCLLLYLNCVPRFRGYLIVPGFEIVGQRSTHWLIYFRCVMWLIVIATHWEKASWNDAKNNNWLLFPTAATGELFVREVSFSFIIRVSIRLLLYRLPGCTFPYPSRWEVND